MIKVEVCINSDGKQSVNDSVLEAILGGASRIELCSAMQHDGLTPGYEQIVEAKNSIGDKACLMVMIRPRKGNFVYSRQELIKMEQQIIMAADAGADGIVLGLLGEGNRDIDRTALENLMKLCSQHHLKSTFHRAFDAIPTPLESIETLIDCGVNHILTSGTKWGEQGGVMEGINNLIRIIEKSQGRIEIVIGGGINSENVSKILNNIPLQNDKISVHAYSGAQVNGLTSMDMVKELVKAVEYFDIR